MDTSSFCARQALVKHYLCHKEAHPLYCRSWSCERCAPRRRNQLLAKTFAGRPNAFITITWRASQDKTVEQAEREQAAAWKAWVRAWRVSHKDRCLAYFVRREYTKAGWPHLHILIRGPWIDRKELAAFMAARIASPVVDIRRIYTPNEAMGYLAKYVGKTYERKTTGKRYWCTPDWDLSKVKQPDGTYKSTAEEAGFYDKPIEITRWPHHTPHACADYHTLLGYTTFELKPGVWFMVPPTGPPAARIAA